MRVLHVADRLTDRGGAYAWMLGVLGGLIEAGHDLHLAVGIVDGSVPAPCPVAVHPAIGARGEAGVDLGGLVASFAPAVVHLHNVMNPVVLEWAAGLPGAVVTVQDHRVLCPSRGKWTRAGEECRQPMGRETCAGCFEDETYYEEILALTERRLRAVRRVAAVTVLSRYMHQELVGLGVSASRVRVVPPFVHGFDHHTSPSGPPCVLFVGRLVHAKGVLEAAEAWRRSGVDLPLVVAGAGPLRGSLETLARRTSGPPLELAGWVGREALSSLYRRARVLVLPSRWQEPCGIVGLEALSFGVPVAAWESGGVGEWHPGMGLVRWGDVDALAESIAQAVGRRIIPPLAYPVDEALGRLVALYESLARPSF